MMEAVDMPVDTVAEVVKEAVPLVVEQHMVEAVVVEVELVEHLGLEVAMQVVMAVVKVEAMEVG